SLAAYGDHRDVHSFPTRRSSDLGNAFGPKSVTFNATPWYPDSVLLGQGGDYYVTSGRITNYQATGTLTSETFEITHPFASFKVRSEEHTSELQSRENLVRRLLSE